MSKRFLKSICYLMIIWGGYFGFINNSYAQHYFNLNTQITPEIHVESLSLTYNIYYSSGKYTGAVNTPYGTFRTQLVGDNTYRICIPQYSLDGINFGTVNSSSGITSIHYNAPNGGFKHVYYQGNMQCTATNNSSFINGAFQKGTSGTYHLIVANEHYFGYITCNGKRITVN